jgi:hypothetical protein
MTGARKLHTHTYLVQRRGDVAVVVDAEVHPLGCVDTEEDVRHALLTYTNNSTQGRNGKVKSRLEGPAYPGHTGNHPVIDMPDPFTDLVALLVAHVVLRPVYHHA